MPSSLFEGSLLLGGLAKSWLGGAAGAGAAPTLIHPSLIAGWCGLVVTSLNLLPVGCLDGGRMVQVRACLQQRLAFQHFLTLRSPLCLK